MAQSYFSISSDWVRRAAEAIGSRSGVILTDALSKAEVGGALTLKNADARTVAGATRQLSHDLTRAVLEFSAQHPLPCSRAVPHAQVAARVAEEQQLCTRAALRVAMTGAIVQAHRAHPKAVPSPAGAASASDGVQRSCQDELLRGLLFAFDAFVGVHAMNRDHYPPRVGNKTAGTVGWDTLVLLHFVHHIPQLARQASGSVIDAATGELVRSWRKLLVALQTVDAQEAPEHSRRRGALALVNGLLIIMFQRYNTHQCAVFLSTVEHAEAVAQRLQDSAKSILQPSQHMVSEVVTYHYYKGRMCLYERRFSEAYEALRVAYTRLPPEKTGTTAQQCNKQRVRFFLLVAGVLGGQAPPASIRRADATLTELFAPLLTAMERGDAAAYSAALEKSSAVWRRRGVYLLLQQQGRLLSYLMLLARVHAAIGAMPGKDSSRITLANLTAAHACVVAEGKTRAQTSSPQTDDPATAAKKKKDGVAEPAKELGGVKRLRSGAPALDDSAAAAVDDAETRMDDDRMALWVAKLIAKGYVRGYLSHEYKTVVLSKKDPFPILQRTEPTAPAGRS